MFDTHLIYQVVEWERRIEFENEKRNSPRRDMAGVTASPELLRAERGPIFTRVFRAGRNRGLAVYPVETAGSPDSPLCCESSAQ